jgi:hypothetical protein
MKIFSLRYTLCLPSVRLLKEDAMLHAIFIIVTEVNPVRKSSTFQRGGSHGALNPVFALKGIITSSPLQAAGLSNGVKDEREKI